MAWGKVNPGDPQVTLDPDNDEMRWNDAAQAALGNPQVVSLHYDGQANRGGIMCVDAQCRRTNGAADVFFVTHASGEHAIGAAGKLAVIGVEELTTLDLNEPEGGGEDPQDMAIWWFDLS